MSPTPENILRHAQTEEEASLSSLEYWLQYEKHTWIIGGTFPWLPYPLILHIIAVITILFTPYMLWHLYKAKWYKAILVFSLVVLLPFLIGMLFRFDNMIISFLIRVLPIVTFYFYTYVLSYLITNYLMELDMKRKWKEEGV